MYAAIVVIVVMRRCGAQRSRLEVEGWGDGIIVSESMQIRHAHENGRAAFSDFSTLRPVFKKVRFHAPCGQLAKTMQNVCLHKNRFHVDSPSDQLQFDDWGRKYTFGALWPPDLNVCFLHPADTQLCNTT